MNTQSILTTARVAAVCLMLMIAAFPSLAADECRLYYQYKSAGGSPQSAILDLDQGEAKSVGQTGVLYIQNKANHPINIEITNLWPPYGNKWVMLNASGVQDPPTGSYTGNVTLHHAECVGEQGFSSPDQLVGALKAAGIPVDEIAGQLAATFGQTGLQVATLLRQANYASGQVTQALISTFNANGRQVAGWLRQADYSAAQVASALIQYFSASFLDAGQWMQQAGFAMNEVARVLKDTFNASAADLLEFLRSAYDASDAAVRSALEYAGFTATQIAEVMVGAITIEYVLSGFTGGFHSIPNATPLQDFPIQPGANRITIRGRGLGAVTSISGLPAGSSAQVGSFGTGQSGPAVWDYRRVEISVPASARTGTRGTARLMVGRMQGPTFNWIVQVPQRAVATPPPPSRGGGGTALPDLQPLPFVGTLYKVGSATTMDANGDTFTALDPFQGSTFCQGLAQGTVNRDNMPTSITQQIIVPDIRWGVENSSSVDVTTAFTIRLLHGGQQVASQNITRLPAGGNREFTFQRPQSQTTVARVGLGDGCYHVGLSREGWNDNSGYSVEVDFGSSVTESSESNNRRSF